jgi:hypothetical protein
LVYNKQNFVTNGFGNKLFDKYTQIAWQTINIDTPMLSHYEVQRADLMY